MIKIWVINEELIIGDASQIGKIVLPKVISPDKVITNLVGSPILIDIINIPLISYEVCDLDIINSYTNSVAN